jgi:hypothetical protein
VRILRVFGKPDCCAWRGLNDGSRFRRLRSAQLTDVAFDAFESSREAVKAHQFPPDGHGVPSLRRRPIGCQVEQCSVYNHFQYCRSPRRALDCFFTSWSLPGDGPWGVIMKNRNLVVELKLRADSSLRVIGATRIQVDGRGSLLLYDSQGTAHANICLRELQSCAIRRVAYLPSEAAA